MLSEHKILPGILQKCISHFLFAKLSLIKRILQPGREKRTHISLERNMCARERARARYLKSIWQKPDDGNNKNNNTRPIYIEAASMRLSCCAAVLNNLQAASGAF
jgi:hypothetical protein